MGRGVAVALGVRWLDKTGQDFRLILDRESPPRNSVGDRYAWLGLWWLVLAWCAGCGQGPSSGKTQPPAGPDAHWFEDATRASGVDFGHQADAPGNFLIHESIGSGAAFLDFDNDGRLDLYFIHNAQDRKSVV